MEYIHVKNIEKYHPGYKDRPFQWAKIFTTMIQGDPDCEQIVNEVDWARLVKLILLELQAKKPIPNDFAYLHRKGFNLKQRHMSSTLKALEHFVEITNEESVTDPLRNRNVSATQSRVEKSRVEKSIPTGNASKLSDDDFFSSLKERFSSLGVDVGAELVKMDAWLLSHPGRKKTRKFITNWLNRVDMPVQSGQSEFKRATKFQGLPSVCQKQPI